MAVQKQNGDMLYISSFGKIFFCNFLILGSTKIIKLSYKKY